MSMFLEKKSGIEKNDVDFQKIRQNNYISNPEYIYLVDGNNDNIYREIVQNVDLSKVSVIKYSGMLNLKNKDKLDSVDINLKTYNPINKKYFKNNIKKQNISICYLTPIFLNEIAVQFDEKILATLAL